MKVNINWRITLDSMPPLKLKGMSIGNFFQFILREKVLEDNKKISKEVMYMRKAVGSKKLKVADIEPVLDYMDSESREAFEQVGRHIFDYCHRDLQIYILAKSGVNAEDLYKALGKMMPVEDLS